MERLEKLLKNVKKNVGEKPVVIIIGEVHPTNHIVTEIIEFRKKGLSHVNIEMARRVIQIEREILEKILGISGTKALYLEGSVDDSLGNLLKKFDGVYGMDENNRYYEVMKNVLINVYNICLKLAPLYGENRDVEGGFEEIKKSLENIQEIFEKEGILHEEIKEGNGNIPIELFFTMGFDEIKNLSREKNVENFKEKLELLEGLALYLYRYIFEKYNPEREKYWIDLINKDKSNIKVIIVGKDHISSLEEALRNKYIVYIIDIEEFLKT